VKTRVIFDTDAGNDIDDLELVGVTTVSADTQVMNAARVDATSPEYLTITDALDAEALKRRYIELVFSQATTQRVTE